MSTPDHLAVVPRGYKKIVDVCGLRWPRSMPVVAAAAYIGLTEFRFRSEPELAKLKAEFPQEYYQQEEDVLTYAQFPQVAPKFFEQRKQRG